MARYEKTIAGNQPDDTQGIAKVGLIDGSTNKKVELVGCVIHLSKKDESLRNILKVETNIEMEYFIFVPWFHSCRREVNENSTKIEVKLHRYKKEQGKKFSVDKDNSKTIFENYHSDNYFVIPCPELKNFQKSSFFKKWSSDLLLHNNSRQISLRENSFCGFKKGETSFKYCWFDKEFDKLEKQGVLLIRSSNESYVIGCYKKENGRINKYCFLLKGLEDIDEPAERRRSLCGRSEEGRGNPPLDQLPSGRNEGTHGAGDSHPPPLPTVRTDGSAGTLPPQQSPRSEEGRANPPLDQLLSGRSEGTHGAGNSHPPHLPSARTDGSGGTLPPQLRPRSEEGRGNPPPDQLLSGRSEGGRGNPTAEQRPLSRSEATGGVGGSITPQLRPDEAFPDFLHSFAKKVGIKWKFLGRHLGIEDCTIEAIDDDYKHTEEKAVQMFSKWQQKWGEEATPAKLKEVLEKKLENRQLAEEVEEWMRAGESRT